MHHETEWGPSVWRRLLAVLFTCSIIIIPMALGNLNTDENLHNGHTKEAGKNVPVTIGPISGKSPYDTRNKQGVTPVTTDATTTTTASPPTTSTDPPVRKQRFHELADDLRDEYFSYEEVGSEEKPDPDVNNGKGCNVSTTDETAQPVCPPCTAQSPSPTTSTTEQSTTLMPSKPDEAKRLKDLVAAMCSIFSNQLELSARGKLERNEYLEGSCNITVDYIFQKRRYNYSSFAYEIAAEKSVHSNTIISGYLILRQGESDAAKWYLSESLWSLQQAWRSFLWNVDELVG